MGYKISENKKKTHTGNIFMYLFTIKTLLSYYVCTVYKLQTKNPRYTTKIQ